MTKIIEKPKIIEELASENLSLVLEKDDVFHNSFINQIIDKKIITGIEFNECILKKIDFSTNNTYFKNIRFIDIIFENCDFSNTTFELCSFTRCTFVNCKLLGVNIFNSSLFNITFNGLLRYINFANNKLKNIEFNQCILDEGRFIENKFKQLYFYNCNLERTEFIKCDLAKIDLTSCNFDDLIVSINELNGVVMNTYKACLMARKLGIKIEG